MTTRLQLPSMLLQMKSNEWPFPEYSDYVQIGPSYIQLFLFGPEFLAFHLNVPFLDLNYWLEYISVFTKIGRYCT